MISDKELANLSVEERIRLIEKIWSSLEAEQFLHHPEQLAEIDRRLERFKNGQTKFFSWEDIKQEIQSNK